MRTTMDVDDKKSRLKANIREKRENRNGRSGLMAPQTKRESLILAAAGNDVQLLTTAHKLLQSKPPNIKQTVCTTQGMCKNESEKVVTGECHTDEEDGEEGAPTYKI